MAKVKVAFSRWDGGTLEEARNGKILVGFQEIWCHMIFDIEMDSNFKRKARLVAGAHKTVAPTSITYSSVILRERVQLDFTITGLNELDMYMLRISQMHIYMLCAEKDLDCHRAQVRV